MQAAFLLCQEAVTLNHLVLIHFSDCMNPGSP